MSSEHFPEETEYRIFQKKQSIAFSRRNRISHFPEETEYRIFQKKQSIAFSRRNRISHFPEETEYRIFQKKQNIALVVLVVVILLFLGISTVLADPLFTTITTLSYTFNHQVKSFKEWDRSLYCLPGFSCSFF